LVIPIQVRTHAMDRLGRAERQVVLALEAAADTYAPEVFVPARTLVGQARAAKESGDYSRTVSLSKRGQAMAEQALALSDERAPVQQEATLSFAHGLTEKSLDGGVTWSTASAPEVIPVGGQLRTGPSARAEVTLADGSVIQIQQDSQFELIRFRLERRTGVRSSRLKVYAGGILGTVEPEKVKESEFQIDTGAASVAIRGTRLRVAAENRDTRLSMLQGETLLSAGGKSISVPERFGAVSRDGRPPASPVELLPPPTGFSPQSILHRTADQAPILRWLPVTNPRTAGYRVEIARDTRFHTIVQDHRVAISRVQAQVLSGGRYFWRVLSFDRDGIEGAFSESRGLEIVKNLEVAIHPTEPLIPGGAVRLARPQVGYLVRAARTDTSVVRTLYSLDGATWMPADEAIQLGADGDYTIQARGECREGERGPIHSLEVRVDGSPPVVTADVGPPTDVEGLGPTVFVSLSAKDAAGVARIEYGFDGREFLEYSQPVAFSAIARGRLYYRAFDSLGNGSSVERLDLPGEPVPR
jgi:hypothetical protein